MSAAFLQYLHLRRRFKQGDWQPSLRDDAAQLATQTQQLRHLHLYVDIQHSLCGFDTTSLLQLEQLCCQQKNYFNSTMHHRLLALKLEHNVIEKAELDQLSVTPQLSRYPGLLCAVTAQKLSSAPQMKLRKMAMNLRQRTSTLELWIKHKSTTSRYCVVGNAPTEQGKSQQTDIDSCNVVFRFNRVHTSAEHQQAYGSRTDAWVVSPAYKINQQDIITSEVFVSGVSVFNKPSRYWQSFASHESLKLHTFPQSVWYELVAKLRAPPTAGLLCLASLQKLRPASSSLSVFGISRGSSSEVNHYGDNTKRSGRHNWQRESQLVNEILPIAKNVAG